MLKRLWNLISNIGLQNSITSSTAKYVKLTNQLTLFSFVFTVIYLFVFRFWGVTNAVYIQLAILAIYATVLLLSYFKFFLVSRFLFIVAIYAHMFALCLCFGEASEMHLLFIPVAAIPLILWDLKEVKTITVLVFLAIVACSTLYAINFSSLLASPIPLDLSTKMRFIFSITAIICEIAVIYAFIYNYNRTEKKLDESNAILQQQLQSVFENSVDALFLVDWQERKIIRANQRAIELFQMNSETDFYDKFGTDFHKTKPTEYELNSMRDAIMRSGKYEGEFLYTTNKGNEFWGALALKLLIIGDKKYHSVRLRDITADKNATAQIEASLHEKEVLLAEIHHRVKNNMAVISGLLGLQSTYIEDKVAAGLFEESRNRIHSMALIHDKLYQHETFARIDFSAYINDLISHIRSSYNAGKTEIRYTITCNDVFVDIKNAVPCGLIMNELLSNAYKHAFTGREEGLIKIVCTKMGGKFTMMVCDDGIGFESKKAVETPVSLGLTLINALVGQLNVNLKTENNNGTSYYISFEE
jgi:PAS domain S-box-containing protein